MKPGTVHGIPYLDPETRDKPTRRGETVDHKKESNDSDDEWSVKCIISHGTNAIASHLIMFYVMRWRVETFFRNTKQDLGFGDCDLRQAAGFSYH